MSKPILLVDQDGVLANFDKSYDYFIKKTPEIKFPHSQYKFFENLEPIEGALESLKILEKYYDVVILTRPSVMNPLCYTEKRVWVEKYFGYDMCKNLILCYDKTMLMGNYLVDDNIHTGRFDPTWEHIHFGTEKFKNWRIITDYLMKEIR